MLNMNNLVVVLVFIFAFFNLVCGNGERSERLLLNDIDVHQLLLDVNNLKQTVTRLQSTINTQSQTINSLQGRLAKEEQTGKPRGAVYTRWGRAECPTNGTEMVYTGFAAGGYYSHSGSAVDSICLPHDPYFFQGLKALNTGRAAYVYGAEYEDNVFGTNMKNKDVPCAVCMTKDASTVLMVPGKISCHSGWKLEYFGLLTSNSYEFASASQYVCVDKHVTALEGGSNDQDGKLFYPVHATCTSLRCPPYESGALITCAVCSK